MPKDFFETLETANLGDSFETLETANLRDLFETLETANLGDFFETLETLRDLFETKKNPIVALKMDLP
eukprot:1330304-Amorphochlora_amoeboformis.AAC.1